MSKLIKVIGVIAVAGAALVVVDQLSRNKSGSQTEGAFTMSRSLPVRLFNAIFELINKFVVWHKLPFPLALLNLVAIRNKLREHNLHDTETLAPAPAPGPDPSLHTARSFDGSYNDLRHPNMGKAGQRFARNIPLQYAYPDEAKLLKPNPRLVSQQLLKRDTFKPVPSLNVLAAAWLQFNVHDWFNHGPNEPEDPIEVPLDPKDPWHEHPMRIHRTRRDPTWSPDEGIPPTYRNIEEHWWGGSQIYGSSKEVAHKLRSHEGGKLTVAEDGLLPVNPETGIDITGASDNWWIGLALLHNLFTLEHNAICDRLRSEHPRWSDDQFYDRARLINSALMAKIHTVEWTPGILNTPVMRVAMRGNWWGALGEQFHRRFGRVSSSEVFSGIPGSPTDHHSGAYAMTEEFVAVYRLHALMPDDFGFWALKDGHFLQERDFNGVAFGNARQLLNHMTMEDIFYSLGITNPGAVTLHNFPRSLQEIRNADGRVVDLAVVDVLRDRERGVPRYNQFRRLLHMKPFNTFEELTSNPVWAEELRSVYNNDIEMVDTMVGLYAETPPPGFGFSDTAFRIFVLMASRRLKSDRFFTRDYRPEVYTQAGLDWIADNTMTSVLYRHFPALAKSLRHDQNPFAPWQRVG